MKLRWLGISLVVLLLLGLATYSYSVRSDDRHVVKARLTGFQETPAISTTGRGEFRARLSDTSVEFELTFSDLTATTLFAHIHLGQRGVAGGVIAFLCGGGGRPACPASGTVTGTITAADIIGPAGQGIAPGEFAEALRAIRSGVTYANVHSTTFPAGEIRGQIRTDNDENPD